MCILATIWLHNNPGLFLGRPEACVFQVWLWSKRHPILARCTNSAVPVQVVFFTSPGHQAGGSSGASQGAQAHNSSLLHTSWVAVALLDVMLHQLCAEGLSQKRDLSVSFLSQQSQCMWITVLTSSLLGYKKEEFHSCLIEFQVPEGSWESFQIPSGLCHLKIDKGWLFLYFPISCFSRCLAVLKADAGPSAVALMLYSCSAEVCTGSLHWLRDVTAA